MKPVVLFLTLLPFIRPCPHALAAGATGATATPTAAGTPSSSVLLRVPDDYPNISAALAAAAPGDTVGVRAGTYVETFVPRNAIPVLGGYDPTFSIRDPELHETTLTSAGRIVECQACAGPTAVIDGFTMTGGGAQPGGLVLVDSAAPTFSRNRFVNANGGRGGSIYLTNSSSRLSDNVFSGSRSAEVGGALAVFFSNGATVAVAEGRYPERVTLKDRVLFLGGWRDDFDDRNPLAYPTIIDAGGFLSAGRRGFGSWSSTLPAAMFGR